MIKNVLPFTLVLFLFVSTAAAQSNTLPSPGITPGNPFYFLDTFFEKLRGALTFGSAAKAKFNLELAEERLAEAKALAEKGSSHVEKTVEAYAKALENALTFAEASKSITVTERIAERTAAHSAVLENLIERVPEEATFGIEQALTASEQGNLQATESAGKLLQETKESPTPTDEETFEEPSPSEIKGTPPQPESTSPAPKPSSAQQILPPQTQTPIQKPPPSSTVSQPPPTPSPTPSPSVSSQASTDVMSKVNTISSLSNSFNSINSSAQSFSENEDL